MAELVNVYLRLEVSYRQGTNASIANLGLPIKHTRKSAKPLQGYASSATGREGDPGLKRTGRAP